MKIFLVILFIFCAALQTVAADTPQWRQATEKELVAVIPDRAPVEKERIETEFRTASGVTDGRGKFIAGVVMITAGYSAEGKYSHFFITQVPIKMGDVTLRPGEYVFGYRRVDNESLRVMFYTAASGELVGAVKARVESKRGPIRSLLITPPGGGEGLSGAKSIIQIGRFFFEYTLLAE